MLALTGAAAAGVAGCLGNEVAGDPDGSDGAREFVAEREAYVVVYHWGFAAFDGDGEELDTIEVAPNTEVTLHAVNDHADDAIEALPDPVAAELDAFDGLERTRRHVEEGRLPEPGRPVEEVYEEAHGHDHGEDRHDAHHDQGGHHHGHDHDDHHHHEHGDHGHEHGHAEGGHGGHGDGSHAHDGKLDHGLALPGFDVRSEVPADAEEPTTVSFVAEEPGTYEAACIVPCGYYHAHQRGDLIEVTADA